MATFKKTVGITNKLDQLRDIKFINRDFQSLKAEMNLNIQKYFPEVSSDVSEGSGLQVLVELMAYVADTLNFYLDKTFNELILDRVFEVKNAYDLAKGLGYQPKPVRPSVTNLAIQLDLPITGSATSMYHFSIGKGTTFSTNTSNITFENLDPIIFNDQTAANFNPMATINSNGISVTRLSTTANIVSGTTNTFLHYFDNTTGIRRMHIPESNQVHDILNVTDSDGNTWYQVRSLAQEFIFTGVPNINNNSVDSNLVPFVLTVKRVPRRFVAEYNSDGSVDLVFGSGDIDLTDTEFILDPSTFVFPNKTQGRFNDFIPDSIQLEDFLNTTSLGVSPQNTNVLVEYRSGGGIAHNVGANTITKVSDLNISWYSANISAPSQQFVNNSFVVTNPEPAQGGMDAETIQQIQINASYNYAAQDRVVSITDYIARVSEMPSAYGSLYKVIANYAKNQSLSTINTLTSKITQLVNQRKTTGQDDLLVQEIINLNEKVKNNSADVTLSCLCIDNNGFLQKPTQTLKNNVSTYINFFKVISDNVEIDAIKIINLSCVFTLNIDTQLNNPSEILLNALQLMRDYLSTSNMEVGKDLNLDDIRSHFRNNMKGVISIPEIRFVLMNGSTMDGRIYSNDYTGDISQFQQHASTIISCPPDSIFEIKYPLLDIVGKFDN